MMTRKQTMRSALSAIERMPVKWLAARSFFPSGLDSCGCALAEMARKHIKKSVYSDMRPNELGIVVIRALKDRWQNERALCEIGARNDEFRGDGAERWEWMHSWLQEQVAATEVES